MRQLLVYRTIPVERHLWWQSAGCSHQCSRGLGACGHAPPRGECPVGQHGQQGGKQRSPGGDEGDLPAGHATDDDGGDVGRDDWSVLDG
jgi:hypothetical protein